MKTILTVGVLAAFSLGTSSPAADVPAQCAFEVPRTRPAADVVGPPELVARLHVMTQPDSPLAIVRVDLNGVKFATGPGWYEKSGTYILDVRNIGNRVLNDASVWVYTKYGSAGTVVNESGGGTGISARRPIAPGEQLSLTIKSGRGQGRMSTDAEGMFVALVEQVRMPECTFKPSQTWPLASAAQ